MSHFSLDASAVVKRYSPEVGTAWIKALTDPGAGHTIILGEITLAEVAAAIAAKHRAPGGLTAADLAPLIFVAADADLPALPTPQVVERRVSGP